MPQSSINSDPKVSKAEPKRDGPQILGLFPANPKGQAALGGFLILSFLAFPRLAPCILLGIVLASILIGAVVSLRGGEQQSFGPQSPAAPMMVAFAFLFWALIACAWSADPIGGLSKVLILAGVLIMILVAIPMTGRANPSVTRAVWHGMIIGLLLGAVYLSVEAITARGVTKFLFTHFPFLQSGYEKHIRIRHGAIVNVSDANINRATAVFTLFLWPALLAGYSTLKGRLKAFCLAGLAIAALVLMVYSRHQTSQLAILASTAILGMAWIGPTITRRFVAVGWVAVTALVVPLSLAAYTNQLQLSDSLFNTAKARIIIWGYTSEQVLQHPVIGVGTNATGALDKQRATEKDRPSGYASAKETRAHPHNFYLQVWYELGAIGALLFAALGVAAATGIRLLPAALQPVALAQFTLTAAMIGSSYGLWQTWLQATIAFSLIAMLMALRLARPTTGAEKLP